MTAIRRRDVGGAWHIVEAPFPAPAVPLAALERNRTLGGFAKIALATDGSWQVRAEIPLAAGAASAQRRADTEAGFAAALGIAPAAPPRDRVPAPRDDAAALRVDDAARRVHAVTALRPDSTELLARGTATGWPCVALSDGRIAVALGLRARIARARIGATGDGLRVWAELDCVPTPFEDPCGRALAIFLARAAATVRLVRPVVESRAGHAAIAFEARYAGGLPGPDELAHALAALGVAADLTSREVRVLARDPALADAYLRLHDDTNPAGLQGPTPTAGALPAHEGEPR